MRSLSNLYKPWFVNNKNARVIDSDVYAQDLIRKEIKKSAQTSDRLVDPDGFAPGIFAEDAADCEQEEVDYVALAKEEAEQILEEAKSRAESIVAQANAQRDEVFDSAREEGYQNGKEMYCRELAEQKEQLEADYAKRQENLENDYCGKRERMEHDLVDVILEVFDKVFLIQFSDKKEILLSLINNTILHIEGEKSFRIRVAGDNVQFVENHKESILERVGHDIGLDVVADSALEGSDCIIETDAGVFECSLGVQLENLIKDIRSLSC